MQSSIPVDLTRLTGLMCVSAPEQRTDLDGQVRKDRDGNTLWVTGIALRRAGTRKASVIDVQTAAEPVGVAEGTMIGLTELDVTLWEIEGRHGLSYRAASIYPRPAESAKTTRSVKAEV
ncbi:hypothetical protein [Actinoplanes sp. NPDC049802]|uniref:hypothetical protein n=1 Tax=Actinoplanes sp. NPDC049802 TaxID=3154742 RepID=UPI0033C35E77